MIAARKIVRSSPRGMTLVEFMVAIGITAILMTITVTIFMNQNKTYVASQDAHEAQETMPAAIHILQQDLMEAGWSVLPQMAFFFNDGGTGSPDEIYLNDVNVIILEDDVGIWTSTSRKACPGGMEIDSVASSKIKVQYLDLNYNEFTDDSRDDEDDFFTGAFVIAFTSGAPAVAPIDAKDNTTSPMMEIDLGSSVTGSFSSSAGDYIAPAIRYRIDNNALVRNDRDSAADNETNPDWTIAEGIVDLQVAYLKGGSWVTTPVAEDPRDIDMIRVTLVTRSDNKVVDSEADPDRYCRPGVENRAATNPSNATEKEAECGYRYRTYTIQFAPRNARS